MGHDEPEQLQLMFIRSCLTEEYKSGYHTSIITAENLSYKNRVFRITLMDGNGQVFLTNINPISLEILRRIIKEYKK